MPKWSPSSALAQAVAVVVVSAALLEVFAMVAMVVVVVLEMKSLLMQVRCLHPPTLSSARLEAQEQEVRLALAHRALRAEIPQWRSITLTPRLLGSSALRVAAVAVVAQ